MKTYRNVKIIKQEIGDPGLKNSFIIVNFNQSLIVINWNIAELREKIDHLLDDLGGSVVDGIIYADVKNLDDYAWLKRSVDLTQPVRMW